MPLRATVDGTEIVAPLVGDDAWAALKQAVRGRAGSVQLPCCAADGFLRTSKLGTKHFVHKRNEGCPGSGETMQHLWAKAEVLKACADAGWTAAPEVAGADWRADVLAERGRAKVAVEVQWSRQDEGLSRFRQDRYARDGVRACWLLRGEQPRPASRELPVFEMRPGTVDPVSVWHAGREIAVREFVRLLLEGKVAFAVTTIRRVRIRFLETSCWRCKKTSHIYDVSEMIRCGHRDSRWAEPGEWMPVDGTAAEFAPDILQAVNRWLSSEGSAAGVRLGPIKKRYSRTMESSYMSFGCPSCDALFGSWFVHHQELLEAEDSDFTHSFEFERPYAHDSSEDEEPSEYQAERISAQAHWCLPADGRYCDTPVARRVAA